MAICPQCARENPEGARFCNACGAPVGQAAETREERKVVTVLFCDLVGFTARSEHLDPEDVRALLRPYHARVRAELERHGGTVEKFVGDAVMAVFGAPLAHEDDPERAVRAALAICAWAESESGLDVRVAVNTGEALVMLDTRPELGEAMAAGDVVNTAARMQAAAPLNGVLVGERTFRATRDAIEYRPAEPIAAKGKDQPVAVWRAADGRTEPGAGVASTPLVGRLRELELLASTLARVREERSPQLVTLIGVPGIGKSRLVRELSDATAAGGESATWYRGRCLPYGSGSSYSAFAEIVKACAGILDGDRDQDVAEKLRTAVAAAVPEEVEARWIEAELRALVRSSADARAGSGESATAAWRRFVEALAEQSPLVLVFEDLHWADDGLLDFVDEVAGWAREVPLLLLSTARPELLERRPGWSGGKLNATTISLAPLGDAETRDLVGRLLGRADQPEDVRQELVRRAGGNPLFTEQYVRMLDERDPAAEAVSVPDSVHGIIAARLDALPPAEKQLLQDAAVVGQVFWPGVVSAIGDADGERITPSLQTLERKEYVQRERRSTVAGNAQYSFRHVLLRDVAYGQIPRRLRGEKHRRAAEWIEALGGPDDRAETIAHHYREALGLARATGAEDPRLLESARASSRDAAQRAVSLNAFQAAAGFFAEALELTPDGHPERPRLLLSRAQAMMHIDAGGVDLIDAALASFQAAGDREGAAEAATVAASARWQGGDRAGADRYVALALELVADQPSSRAQAAALVSQCGFHMLAGEFEDGLSVGRRALAIVEALGLERERARVLILAGCCRCCLGDAEGVDEIEAGIGIASAAGSPDMETLGYGNLASELCFLGRLAEAGRAWDAEVELSERYGLIRHRRGARATEAGRALMAGRWDDATRLADGVVAELGARGQAYGDCQVLSIRAYVRLGRGDLAGAGADSGRAVDLARTSDAQARSQAFTTRALVALAAGRRDEADVLAGELVAIGPVLLPALCTPFPTLADVAWAFRGLGRIEGLLGILDATPIASGWMDAARAIATGELAGAADIMADMGHAAGAAYARARAAEELGACGMREEAERQAELAAPFIASAGATAFLD